MTELAGWTNFYVIVGSSAGALIGLQFVVMALVADLPRTPEQAQAGHAFATPNIVHFGTALLLSAIITAPWQSIGPVTVICSILGLCGIVYSILVIRRMGAQNTYRPVLEDWTFYGILPFVAYTTLAASGYAARQQAHGGMFGVAASALLLLFVGIHNAWDAASYHVFVVRPKRANRESSQ